MEHPGILLAKELEKRGWGQNDLTFVLGCSPKVVNQIVNGKQGIGLDEPLRVGPVVTQDPRNAGPNGPNTYFLPNAFASEGVGQLGNSAPRFFHGPGMNNWNLSLLKDLRITERKSLEFRAEFFNAFNHANFAQPDNFIDDGPGSAGVITSVAIPMRQIQLGLKYNF